MNNDTIAMLEHLDLAQLEKLRDTYEARHDSASAEGVRTAINRKGLVQTDELSRSGKLFMHKIEMPDDSGRKMTTWTGDCAVWMSELMSPGVSGHIDAEIGTGANSPDAKALRASQVTVTLKPGERVQVVKADV